MKEPTLFRPKRQCCICECTATRNRGKTVAGEPKIHCIVPYVYMPGAGGAPLEKCRPIHICEDCLARTLIHCGLKWHESGRSLAAAFQDSLLRTYSFLLEGHKR
jgi:hypothetical protein